MKHRVKVFQPYKNLEVGPEYWISDVALKDLNDSQCPAVVYEHIEDDEPGDLTEVSDAPSSSSPKPRSTGTFSAPVESPGS